jgi:hypothetical protein
LEVPRQGPPSRATDTEARYGKGRFLPRVRLSPPPPRPLPRPPHPRPSPSHTHRTTPATFFFSCSSPLETPLIDPGQLVESSGLLWQSCFAPTTQARCNKCATSRQESVTASAAPWGRSIFLLLLGTNLLAQPAWAQMVCSSTCSPACALPRVQAAAASCSGPLDPMAPNQGFYTVANDTCGSIDAGTATSGVIVGGWSFDSAGCTTSACPARPGCLRWGPAP